jgi:ribosome-binding protein aMBF1 (putative translation factor)
MPCPLCKGSGNLTAEAANRYERGRELARIRVNAGVSLRELAKMARLNPTVLSDVEHGRASASEAVAAIYSRLDP